MELSDDEQTSESVVSQTADDARETRDHPWSELGTITTFDGIYMAQHVDYLAPLFKPLVKEYGLHTVAFAHLQYSV